MVDILTSSRLPPLNRLAPFRLMKYSVVFPKLLLLVVSEYPVNPVCNPAGVTPST